MTIPPQTAQSGARPRATILTELGIEPVINATGPWTTMGNASLSPRVIAAMREMAAVFVPMAELLDLHLGLTLAAALGGGIFGDHCSPISDSTIVASMASATDHIDHVRTQLPYALLAAAAALVLFLGVGFIL